MHPSETQELRNHTSLRERKPPQQRCCSSPGLSGWLATCSDPLVASPEHRDYRIWELSFPCLLVGSEAWSCCLAANLCQACTAERILQDLKRDDEQLPFLAWEAGLFCALAALRGTHYDSWGTQCAFQFPQT
uniref:RIKEN cDNA 4933407L21 gene n=1 Tax=Mus spicilegus TaxID=10103 RepID=A0A8C6GAA5_MUSSI